MSQALWTRSPNAAVWQLQNPHASIWHGEPAAIQRVDNDATKLVARGRPLVFVHGMSFRDEHEVLTDFIVPFERQARLFQTRERKDLSVLFVSWDSWMFGHRLDAQLQRLPSLLRAAYLFGLGVPYLPKFLGEIERRARATAETIQPFVADLLRDTAPTRPPLIISHSAGSYLWSYLMCQLLQAAPVRHGGIWWSLQAAVRHCAYIEGGEFADVARIYDGGNTTQLMLWYSRRDIVLSTLYRWAKPGIAMGQHGTLCRAFDQRDVTLTTGEAHGLTVLRSGAGNFFERAGRLIHRQADLLTAN